MVKMKKYKSWIVGIVIFLGTLFLFDFIINIMANNEALTGISVFISSWYILNLIDKHLLNNLIFEKK